ncbi:terminase small subunit [Holzapfeliella sp. He02]|uniref:Terminase small subunit n=1 Tax=Holzapfeliella saturejae TaxID=3082953 RepID=A0ABU8SHD1_9LACO
MTGKLTPKQKQFADEYIKSGNITHSYIKAGYEVKNEKTANAAGRRLLGNVGVKSYIDGVLGDISKRTIMDASEALEILTRIGRGEEKETVYISSPLGVEEKQKEADIKTRISAIKEILKRYPETDSIKESQAEKLRYEIELLKRKLEHLDDSTVSDEITFIDDVPEGDSDE